MMEDYFTQPVLDAVQRLKPLAERAHCTLAQLALAWCLRDEVVSSVIVGATRPEQVDDNVAAARLGRRSGDLPADGRHPRAGRAVRTVYVLLRAG